MSISQYHSAILRDLDILEKATRNDYIQSCLVNIRQNVKELFDDARNYRDALAYINGITKNVTEDMLDDLTPADFKEAFSDVSIDDDNSEMFYNADLLKEALDRGDISKDVDGSYYSSKNSSKSFDEIKQKLDNDLEEKRKSFVETNDSVEDESDDLPDYLVDDVNDTDIPDSVFDFEDDFDHYDFYDDMKALFQKQSPDRLAFLRSTREPTIEVRNEPIDVRELMEGNDESEEVEEPIIEDEVVESLDMSDFEEEPEVAESEDVGVSLDDFLESAPQEYAPEEEEEDGIYDDVFLTPEELERFDN